MVDDIDIKILQYLQKDGRLRTELETWNQKSDIDIIR